MTAQTTSRNTPEQVAKFYDEHTNSYVQAGEDIIQSMRPDDATEFLEYLVRSIGIEDGMRILDAGCGSAGPALYFANRNDIQIECLTISAAECAVAQSKISQSNAPAKIAVRHGDYHELAKHYPPAYFDAIIFLESFGHAAVPEQVLESARHVLKPGGFIYIKDFFPASGRDAAEQEIFNSIVVSIDKNYCYNTVPLDSLLSLLDNLELKLVSMNSPTFTPSLAYLESFQQVFSSRSETTPIIWLEIKCVK